MGNLARNNGVNLTRIYLFLSKNHKIWIFNSFQLFLNAFRIVRKVSDTSDNFRGCGYWSCRPFWLKSVDKKQYKILVEKSERLEKILSCLTLPGASVNEMKLWNVVKTTVVRTRRKRDKHIEQTLIALFFCSTWVKSEDLEEQPHLEVCRGPPGQGRPGQLAAASNLALRGRWPPSTYIGGGAHRDVNERARIISQ